MGSSSAPPPAPTTGDRVIVLIALVLPTAVTWLYFIALQSAPAHFQQGAYGVGKTIQFALPLVWVLGVQRRFERPAIPPRWALVAGALFGLAVAVVMAASYFGLLARSEVFAAPQQTVRAKIASFGIHSPLAYLALAVFYSAVHSLLEEYYWRWFVFGQLNQQTSRPLAIAISSLGFAAHHVLVLALYFGWTSPLTWFFALCVAVGGAVWAWLYGAAGSLAPTWLSHAIVDAAIFAIGYQMLPK